MRMRTLGRALFLAAAALAIRVGGGAAVVPHEDARPREWAGPRRGEPGGALSARALQCNL